MRRRTLIYGAAAGLAGAAGAGVAWQQFQPHQAALAPGAASSGQAGPAAGAAGEFWGLQFETPAGTPLPMSAFRGKPLLVNFWATWCPPCIEELPLLDQFYQTHSAGGCQVLGLAVDQPSAVRKWLAAKPLRFPVGMAGLQGTQLTKTLGNLTGGLPFSVVFGASGDVLHRKIGKLSAEELSVWSKLS